MKYHSFHRQIGGKHDGRGEMMVAVEQYANQIVELADPAPKLRREVYLQAKDIVLELAWASLSAGNINGVRETLEKLDASKHRHRLAKKLYSGS